MDCHRVRMLLNAYIDRELDLRTERIIRNHLTECSECYQEYLEYMTVKAAIADIEEARPSEEFCCRLRNLFEDERELRQRTKNVRCICSGSRRGVWIAAAVVVVAVTAGAASVLVGSMQPVQSGAVYYSMSEKGGARALSERAGCPLQEGGFETQSRICERILLRSQRGNDPRKLYRVVYRSR